MLKDTDMAVITAAFDRIAAAMERLADMAEIARRNQGHAVPAEGRQAPTQAPVPAKAAPRLWTLEELKALAGIYQKAGAIARLKKAMTDKGIVKLSDLTTVELQAKFFEEVKSTVNELPLEVQQEVINTINKE